MLPSAYATGATTDSTGVFGSGMPLTFRSPVIPLTYWVVLTGIQGNEPAGQEVSVIVAFPTLSTLAGELAGQVPAAGELAGLVVFALASSTMVAGWVMTRCIVAPV